VKELERQGIKNAECPRQFNSMIKAADLIIEEYSRPPVLTSEGMGLEAWLRSDDTGASSAYMASILGGFDRPHAYPHDLDDFMRCSRLLIACPAYRSRLSEMKAFGSKWSKLVEQWEVIESLAAEGNRKEANAIVEEIATAKDWQ
jgi:hypothetical protein